MIVTRDAQGSAISLAQSTLTGGGNLSLSIAKAARVSSMRSMRTFTLNPAELDILFLQDANARGDGGWQSLLVKLQDQTDRNTGAITISEDDARRIRDYAFNYGNGGFENRLTGIFARHLGPRLDQ
jgi:hypothetical protein